MAFPRTITARLVERLIFNFRLKPEAMAKYLPAGWLKPQVINGWSVVSFCILDLEKTMLSPFPTMFGYRTTSCAFRCGVLDTSSGKAQPSVYITDRQTDLPLIARLAPWILLDTILMVRPELVHGSNNTDVTVRYLDNQYMFKGSVRPAAAFHSQVFASLQEFSDFIKGGVTSYTPSVYGDSLTRVDLVKDETQYEPLEPSVEIDWLDGAWAEAGVELDSAVRAGHGARYRWTYRGLRPYAGH